MSQAPRAVTFHPDSLEDSDEAAEYYSSRVPQLGDEFIAEIRRVVALVALRPEAGSPMRGGRRRWLLNRFPFGVVYRIGEDGSVRVLGRPSSTAAGLLAITRLMPCTWFARQVAIDGAAEQSNAD